MVSIIRDYMADKMDIGLFRSMVLSNEFQDISNDFAKFDNQKCTFYYDESNNIRKLWLNTNDFNAPIDSDFVLGGVMHFGDAPSADIDILKKGITFTKISKRN